MKKKPQTPSNSGKQKMKPLEKRLLIVPCCDETG